MPNDDTGAVLNLSRLEESAGSDRPLMLELVELYLADASVKVPHMVEAAKQAELEDLGRLAHGLKGSSAAMGCEEAATAFRMIEDMVRGGETTGLDDALVRAQAAWRRAADQLRQFAA